MRLHKTVLAVGAAASLLTACQSDGAPATGPQGDEADRRLTIESPVDGATVAGPVMLRVAAPEGIEIGEPGTGNMHLHVYVDEGEEAIVCNTPVRRLDLAPGSHTLRVVLAQPNHDETDLAETVRLTVIGA